MGAKGKRERPSERKAAAARANARRPRGRWANTPEREQLERAKAELRAAVTGGGADRLAAMILDRRVPDELFLAAFKIAADRTGLPALAHQDIALTAPQREFFIVGDLGWPGLPGEAEGGVRNIRSQAELTPDLRERLGPKLCAALPATDDRQPAPAEPSGALVRRAAPVMEPVAGPPRGLRVQDLAGGGVRGSFGEIVDDD